MWQLFEHIDQIYTKCNIYEANISCKISISNLKSHIRNKHPTVSLPVSVELVSFIK
jgi:hypothetical protein